MKTTLRNLGEAALSISFSVGSEEKISLGDEVEIEPEAEHTGRVNHPIGADDMGRLMVPGEGHGEIETQLGFRVILPSGKSVLVPSGDVAPLLRMELAGITPVFQCSLGRSYMGEQVETRTFHTQAEVDAWLAGKRVSGGKKARVSWYDGKSWEYPTPPIESRKFRFVIRDQNVSPVGEVMALPSNCTVGELADLPGPA